MSPENLAVWLSEERVATLERRRGALWLHYADSARQRFGLGYPLISLSLPVTLRPHRGKVVERFFDGLLPEGQLRRTLAYDFGVSDTDTFGLLREIGRDCAGALAVQPETAPPPSSATSVASPISDEEIATRIANLRLSPLGAGENVRVSLAGMQNKLLLVRTVAGWALPTGAPSSHILKPAIEAFPGSAQTGLPEFVGIVSLPAEQSPR